MKKAIPLIWISFILNIVFGLSACTDSNKGTENTQITQEVQKVKVKEVRIETVSKNLEYTGTIEAFEVIHLGAATPGQVKQVYVEVGDRVEKGQLIALFDQTKLQQAIIHLKTIEMDLNRMDTLLGTGSIPQQQYDQLYAQYQIAESNVTFLEANTKVKSPINGIITGKYIENGEIFSMVPNPKSGGKGAIVTIMNIDKVKVLFGVSEKYFSVLSKGIETEIRLDFFPGKIFHGKIYKKHPTIDRMTRTFTIEAVFPNKAELLRPGMFSRVTLQLGEVNALLVPSLAVMKQTGTNERYVFVFEEGKAIRKTVQVGRLFDDDIEILSGLNTGDQLIVLGQGSLLDQEQVEKI